MSSWFKDFTDKVQAALPTFDDGGLLQSLTLTTPELTAERERIDAEEKRKDKIRNMLTGMLPWETRDPDRVILVEECKDAILNLSKNRETFLGPYQIPPMKAKIADFRESFAGPFQIPQTKAKPGDESDDQKHEVPSKESLDKLSKLEPLPPLLENFEFLAHVGLIELLLKQDPNLVQMQSLLSGGGARERIFWKNYFFHCAYARYEAGLSIDEIWSDDDIDPMRPPVSNVPTTNNTSTKPATKAEAAEETITFDEDSMDALSKKVESNEGVSNPLFGLTTNVTSNLNPVSTRSELDYEIVDDGIKIDSSTHNVDEGIVDTQLEDGEYEMDELEAEIARELLDD